MKFKLQASFKPTGDQPQAIEKLYCGLQKGHKHQTLLGVTGSGKTFTMANIINKVQKPTLIISHNKTLTAQLASEFQAFFPENEVHYFVSYYDYYQPEAYMPRTDTYIEKETDINEEIERLRHASTNALLSRKDVIIVASVSCIYGLGSPEDYQNMTINLKVGEKQKRDKFLRHLTDLQYTRNDQGFYRGNFRVKGDVVEIFQAGAKNEVIKVEFYGDVIERLSEVDWLTGKKIRNPRFDPLRLSEVSKSKTRRAKFEIRNEIVEIFPAKHFVMPAEKMQKALEKIREEMMYRVEELKRHKKLVEAQRLEQRTNFDLEMIEQTGYCNGIENYSCFLTGRAPGERPSVLLDYFPDDFLMFIDESHMTVPQINAMYNGDKARKQTLVDFGFRLPSALDNRPLKFKEFEEHINQVVYVSATPSAYEYRQSGIKTDKVKVGNIMKDKVNAKDLGLRIKDLDSQVVQQVIRPTGLIDPVIEVRKTKRQLDDLLKEIKLRVKKKQRVLVTTITKRLAEDIAEHLESLKVKVQYLHSEIKTLERLDIIRDLRLGKFDVLVGINLLREGLDLPEVSLVAILDADKEGFLRSETALIQVMGRASRHIEGQIIMYADKMTGSMKRAIDEVERRRVIQEEYNKKYGITPTSIEKGISKELRSKEEGLRIKNLELKDFKNIPKDEMKRIIKDLQAQMKMAAENLEFEKAAELRDKVKALKKK